MLGAALLGLLLWGKAWANIALQDGSTALTFANGNTVSQAGFTVTSGANALVVLLVDRNNNSSYSGPASLTWNGGAAQTINLVVQTNGAASTWAWENIYVLYNPSPGTAMITATDAGSPSVMALAAYTLSGVDTNVAPVGFATGLNGVNSVTLTMSGVPTFGWAAVISSYGTTSTGPWGLSALGGPLSWTYGNNTIQEGAGYVGPCSADPITITATDSSGGTQKNAIAAALFSPYLPGPAAPTGLTAMTGETNQVDLSWTDGSGGSATSYVIWRQPSGSNWTAIATNSGNSSVTYTDNGALAWTTWNYLVQAVGAAGAGGFSDLATATPVGIPLAPTDVTVAATGDSAVLNWSAPQGTIGYNVLRSTTSGSGYSSVGFPQKQAFASIPYASLWPMPVGEES